jgi:hypothetical protein
MRYRFNQIRTAVLAAAPAPGVLPYGVALTPEYLAALRATPALGTLLTELRAAARTAEATPIPALPFRQFRRFEDDGDRQGFERPFFDRRGRLLALAISAVVDETAAPIPALEDVIWEICNEYSWAPPACLPVGVAAVRAHHWPPEQVVDLFAAETAHALAETLYLLGDRLQPWLNYRVRSEIERRVFRPLCDDPVHFGWEGNTNNWAAVCAGAAGMAGLLLIDDRERLAGMLDRLLGALACFLTGFGADGGCPEGLGYWVYGFGYYTYFAEMLRVYTGGQLDLLRSEQVARIASFPAAAMLSPGSYVPFSDSFGGRAPYALPTGLISRLAERTGQAVPTLAAPPAFHSDSCYRFAHLTRTLFWTDPQWLGRPVASGTTYLPALAWLIDRQLLGGVPVAFAAKGGHNAEPHNHNDLGHFVLHLGGDNVLTDLGAGLYTRQYFRAERYQALQPSSAGHSVPLIDAQEQVAGPHHAARVVQQATRTDGADFVLDLTRAYALPELLEYRRAFAWTTVPATGTARLALTDTFRFGRLPTSLVEVFVSQHLPALAEGCVTWRGAHGSIVLRFDAEHWRPELETLSDQDHAGQPITVYRLRLNCVHVRSETHCHMVFSCQPEGQT